MNKAEIKSKFIKTVEVLRGIDTNKGVRKIFENESCSIVQLNPHNKEWDIAKIWGVKTEKVFLTKDKTWLTITISSEYLGIEKQQNNKWDIVIIHVAVIENKYHCSIQRPNEILYGIEVLD